MSNHIHFIGGGNMASAIIGGLKTNGFDMSNITVIEPDAEKRTLLSATYGVQNLDTYVENLDSPSRQNIIVLAVKPQILQEVCQNLAKKISRQPSPLIISIAAGVQCAAISRWLGGYSAIVRVMPNTPAQIQVGVSALFATSDVNDAQRLQAEQILSAVGKTLWLSDEQKMDAVTAISGSGPAYVFYLIEALQEAAMKLELTLEEARLLSIETFAGASLLAQQSTTDIHTLRAQVTSKGGTTEQGILALENANTKDIILAATVAAAKRANELGILLGKG